MKRMDPERSPEYFSNTPVSSFAITNDGWSASSPKSASKHSFDLSAVPALNGLSAVYFRLVCNSTTAISGAFGSGGTNRVDNFTITGTPCTGPSAFAVTGGGSYCTGGTGVAVGLAGSASGVNYQLVYTLFRYPLQFILWLQQIQQHHVLLQ